jgi:hypothetical protein
MLKNDLKIIMLFIISKDSKQLNKKKQAYNLRLYFILVLSTLQVILGGIPPYPYL